MLQVIAMILKGRIRLKDFVRFARAGQAAIVLKVARVGRRHLIRYRTTSLVELGLVGRLAARTGPSLAGNERQSVRIQDGLAYATEREVRLSQQLVCN